MPAYVYRNAPRLPAARLWPIAGTSRLHVNVEFEIWLLLGVNVDTPFHKRMYDNIPDPSREGRGYGYA